MFNRKIHYKWSFSIAMSAITRGYRCFQSLERTKKPPPRGMRLLKAVYSVMCNSILATDASHSASFKCWESLMRSSGFVCLFNLFDLVFHSCQPFFRHAEKWGWYLGALAILRHNALGNLGIKVLKFSMDEQTQKTDNHEIKRSL